MELTKAEEDANEKKRKAEGISLEEIGQTVDNSDQKKTKLLEDVDKDEQAGDSAPSAEVKSTAQQNRDDDEEADNDERYVCTDRDAFILTKMK